MEVLIGNREEIKLDKKDIKILEILSKNARQPCTVISKKVRLSHDSVNYRIKRLEEKGIIRGYRTVVNATLFGFYPFHLFVRAHPDYFEKLKVLCIKSPFVRSIIRTYGSYDFQISVVARNSNDLDAKINSLFKDIMYVKIDILITADYLVRGAMLPYFEEPEMELCHCKLDETDGKLIGELCDNPRASLLSISNKIGIGIDSTIKHLKKLEKDKVIISYIPVINYMSMHKSVYIVIAQINDLHKHIGGIKEFSKQNNSLFWAARTMGKYNIILYFSAPDGITFHKAFTEFRRILEPFIQDYELLLGHEQYKFTYFSKELLK